MKSIQAAVLWPGTNTLSVEGAELEDPREDEVLVRVVASGVCHTDMVLRDASITTRPVVLGHEGSGVVEKVGAAVTAFKPGDRVGMSFATCGACSSCLDAAPSYCHQFFSLNFVGGRPDGSTSIRKNGQQIGSHIFGQSSFASHVVCSQRNLVKVGDSIPLEMAGPFGCGFQTGAGAVLNSLQVRPHSSILVLGAGAVGLSAAMAGAYIAGAAMVIVVDVNDARLEIARSVGATHTVNGAVVSLGEGVRKISPDGVDYIVDTTGRIPVVEQAVDLLSIRGKLGLVASYPLHANFTFDISPFMNAGKSVQGIMGGDADFVHFIPRLIEYYRQGKFPVDRLIRYYDFSDINRAIEESERGDVIKAVVTMPDNDK